MSAREEVLGRIRAATVSVPATEPSAWEPDGSAASSYVRNREEAPAHRRSLFVARAHEQGTWVTEVLAGTPVSTALQEIRCRLGIVRAVIPVDLPRAWLPPELELVPDDPSLDAPALAAAGCVVSGAALAIAETATIVLDGGRAQGRRALSLVPDVHLCVLGTRQLVGSVPEAIERLAPAARRGRPLTLISGPSATSDIAFERVVGVHGPRTLAVVLVDDEERALLSPQRQEP